MQYSKLAVVAAIAAPFVAAQSLNGLPACAVSLTFTSSCTYLGLILTMDHSKQQLSAVSARLAASSQTSNVSAALPRTCQACSNRSPRPAAKLTNKVIHPNLDASENT